MWPRQLHIQGRFIALALLCAATAAGASTQTITTTYRYNADGAPTAVTTQVGTQPATTVYLTWDNFTPDAAQPSTGTISAADGNLLGIGPSPGSAGSLREFAYDARDRLTACSVGGQPAASYAYHPAGPLASSTLESGDALQFYWNSGATPLMVNTVQPSTAMAASFLGPVRYLSDGTEQVLLNPRKDTAGIYDATAQTLSSYNYAPYGASTLLGPRAARPQDFSETVRASGPRSQGGYDLTRNPFQYAGEYRDPICDAYYLRARWYLPSQQTFLSRDPGDPLHRYSYTAGNPVGRADPSGLRGVEAGARALLHRLDANQNGPGGIASRFFLGSVLGIAQILANPSGYWHRLEHDSDGIDIFLAAGVAVELGTSGWGPLPELPGSYTANFLGRHAIDGVLGVGQSVASGFHGHRFDWAAVGQGLEYTAGGMFEARELVGIGYKPFGLTAADVTQRATSHFAAEENDLDVLVYRVRGPLFRIGPVFGAGPFNAPQFTSPLLELANLGVYHETLVGVLRQYDDAARDVIVRSYKASVEPLRIEGDLTHQRLLTNQGGVGIGSRESAAFVGRYTGGAADFLAAVRQPAGDRDFLPRWNILVQRGKGVMPADPYRVLGNNCQTFAARIRSNLGFP